MRAVPQPSRYEKITPEGDVIQGGFYDPSLEFAPGGKIGWLAYSAVRNSKKFIVPVGPYVETHVAFSSDGGGTWKFTGAANHSYDDAVLLSEGQTLTGVWRYEVPSIVYDPDDFRKPWKLFSHRYFWNDERDRMPAFGWIAYQWTTDPRKGWSDEVPLFGAGRFPPKPYRTRIDVNGLDASLREIVAYTEPGTFSDKGQLYVCLTALTATGAKKIILLASGDHAESWKYLGTVVSDADAAKLGYKSFDAPDISIEQGRVFLLASPEDQTGTHEGAVAFEFQDLNRAQLKRNSSGEPVILRRVLCQAAFMSKVGCGQATNDAGNTLGGICISQTDLKARPDVFQMFSTRMHILE